jgi:hypothetical protein
LTSPSFGITQHQAYQESNFDAKMASAPPAKKQKVAAYAKAAIVFQAPGFKLDVCLKAFDQEYHVHSILLKLYSEFFRKFLDSPDKITGERAAGSGFRYFWATEVDQDGKDWHLVAVSSQNSEVCYIQQLRPIVHKPLSLASPP